MPTNTRILVVDDDQEIRELLEEYLTKSGFDVSSVGDGVELETHLQSLGYPDLILLDVMLPGDDGFTLCQRVRKQSNVPIIMLTAVSDETDQIIGLEIGADDYIAKPFSPRQLMARIKALLRRVQVVDDKPSDALPKQITPYRFGHVGGRRQHGCIIIVVCICVASCREHASCRHNCTSWPRDNECRSLYTYICSSAE